MKSKILKIALFCGILTFCACDDYLDMTPTDSVSDKTIWSSVPNAEMAINNYYNYISYLSNFDSGQSTAGITEGFTDMLKYGAMTYNAHMYVPNELAYGGTILTPTYVSAYLGNWGKMYEYVRIVNQGLSDLRKWGTGIEDSEFKRLEGEIRFFRAWLYTDLLKRYKQVILYNEDLTQIKKDKPLSPESEGWNMVEADLRFAAANLPLANKNTSNNTRLTSGAAYGLLSRSMLYAKRWDVVVEAYEALEKQNIYGLVDDFADAFDHEKALNGKETLLVYAYDKNGVSHSFDNYFAPGGDENNSVSGGMGTPTQEMVESFELTTGGFPDWSAWHTTSGTDQTPPYADLEPRFQATVLYNGASWKGRKIEPYVGGKDGWAAWKVDAVPAGRTTTGYYLRKLVDETHDFSEQSQSTLPWVAIRYAEVILNYAEASYNLNKTAEANNAVRRIRTRVGLPYSDKAGSSLFDAIRQERKVELAYEGQYYWDMKRWKLAHTAFTGTRVHGLKIEKDDAGTFVYTYVDCDLQDRHFPQKMYQIPLPVDELNSNSEVEQYAEWK